MTKNMNFLSDFGVQPILLAAQVVNFFILLLILKKFLYGPILKVLATRKQKIEGSLKNAEEIERKLAETNKKIDKMIVDVSADGQKIIDEAKKAGVLIIDESHKKAAQDAENIIKKAGEESKLEMERMMKEARSQLLDLSVAILHKITGKVITKDDQKKLFEREIRNLS